MKLLTLILVATLPWFVTAKVSAAQDSQVKFLSCTVIHGGEQNYYLADQIKALPAPGKSVGGTLKAPADRLVLSATITASEDGKHYTVVSTYSGYKDTFEFTEQAEQLIKVSQNYDSGYSMNCKFTHP